MTAIERSRELEFFGWFEAYLELGSTFSEGLGHISMGLAKMQLQGSGSVS